MLTDSEYMTAKAICDKAQSYWEANATFSKGGSSMSAELAKHPDYAACTNDMRGAVEEYELNRDKPDAFSAYVCDDGRVTLWPGNVIGKVTHTKRGKRRDTVTVWSTWGRCYRGFLSHDAQLINLRRVV